MHSKTAPTIIVFTLMLTTVVTACQTKETEVTRVVPEKETIVQTVVETVIAQETVVVTATPAPKPQSERTLVICTGLEPDSLYPIYVESPVARGRVLAAVHDGPFDTRSYGYQPVILEKIPSQADGDAVIETVTVQAGDPVIDDDGAPVILEEGVEVRPARCSSSTCAVAFDGSPLEMEQMVVTFKLKPGITWSDGEPLTAHDSVYGYELIRDPDTPLDKWFVERVASYEAIDDHTTQWTSLPGYRHSEMMRFFFLPTPEHAWGQMTALELLQAEESAHRPLGWGPYVIDEWVKGDHITLLKNERYWRANEGLPKFDKLIYRFTGGGPGAAIAALLSGECDLLDRTFELQDQSELLLELQAKGQINAGFVVSAFWEHADFGIESLEGYERPDFFGDVRTRRAITHCMDRQAVVNAVTHGQSVVLDTYLPPNHPLYNPHVTHYAFDTEKGSALLEEVGWTDNDGDPATPRVAQGVDGVDDDTPFVFTYMTTTTNQRQQSAQVLQASLAECGIQLDLEYWNSPQFFANGPDGPLWRRNFDMAQFSWAAEAEPGCYLYTTAQIAGDPDVVDEFGQVLFPMGWWGNNTAGFSDPAYDAVCDAAMAAIPGTPEYEQHHDETQRIWAEQLPSVPLYPWIIVTATRPDLLGFVMDPTDYTELWNIEEFDILD